MSTTGEGAPTDGALTETRRALEAVVMVAESPADAGLLAQLVEVPPDTVETLLGELAEEYEAEGRGFRLVKVGGGWRFCSHEDLSPYVERYVLSGQSARLSAAALETLAIVAYKQPVSRAQVAAIRGVNVEGVMRTLQQRGYIEERGRDAGPGQATLFGTTSLFLERLGLNDLAELPSLGDFIPGADVVELLEAGLRADAEEAARGGDEGHGGDDGGDRDGDAGVRAGPGGAVTGVDADEPVIDLDALDPLDAEG